MKQISAIFQNTQIKPYITIVSLLLFIWVLGPQIAIAGKIPLASFFVRFITSFFIIIGFAAVKYKQQFQLLYQKNRYLLQSDEVVNETKLLQDSFKAALRCIHSSFIKSLLFKYQKPWFLLLGPAGSGKTTLLTKSDLELKNLDNLPPLSITPTKHINWWFANDAVFIDVGGRYLQDKQTYDGELNQSILKNFFKLLKKYRRQQPLNGLLLTINLQELIVDVKLQSQLKRIRLAVQDLMETFPDFPIYLIITRCDFVEGFTEFFADLNVDERNQIFGIKFPLSAQPQSLPRLFNEQFNTLLQHLHERVLWRLHQENNHDKQGKIKNFPLQMEFLKAPLAKLLNLILPDTELNLRGIYLTSCLQKDSTIDNLTRSINQAFDILPSRAGIPLALSKSFFIPELFKRIIIPEAKYFDGGNKHSHLRLAALVGALLLVIFGSKFYYTNYQQNISAIKAAQNAVASIKSEQNNNEQFINQLNTLLSIMTELHKIQDKWYLAFGLQEANHLNNKAGQIYYDILANQFSVYFQHAIESQLQMNQNQNSSQLYTTLKTYMMLGDSKHYEKIAILNWFKDYWPKITADGKKQQQLQTHLNNYLGKFIPHLTINNQLVDNTRQILNSLPRAKLVLAILQNQYSRPSIKLFSNPENNVFNNLPNEIPAIFNIAYFRDIYYTEILNTCKDFSNGNWVLGIPHSAEKFSDFAYNQLTNEVKVLYINEYAAIWGDILAKIKIDDLQNLSQIAKVVESLNDPQSPIIQLLGTIKTNTQPISDSVEFTQQVSSRFLALGSLSDELLKNTHQPALANLKDYLNKVISNSDNDKACYDAARFRMENHTENDCISMVLQQARLQPEPLKTWYTTIAGETWRLLLKNAENYLNRIWLATVYPQYTALLDKRYPLFKESTSETSLADFSNFFAANGTMDNFFKNYLQPFVDNSRLYWEWKNIDGQRINIPQTTLEMFIRAALIQKMFFPEDNRVPTINFSLVPVELSSNVQSFSLNLDGQTVLFQRDNEQIISLNWPGPQPNHVEINFVDDKGKKLNTAESGAWAWFKILDKCQLESTNNPKHYKLTFEINGVSAKYELFTNGIVNPFIPGILNAFRCPENL